MSKSKILGKIIGRILRLLPFVMVIMLGVPIVGMAGIEGTKLLGIRTIPVPVMGTGSMYPSLFWSSEEGGPEDESKKVVEEYRTTPLLYRRFPGITLFGHVLLRRSIGYGDMVAFKNVKTVEILTEEDKDTTSGFIKRVIGIPGDIIELRDGFVYRNGTLLSEPYIDSPRSTYGDIGLKDCEKITINPGSYFVLGDNRKVSSDSRFKLGLIAEDDIEYILPYADQKIYQSLWRDTSKDSELLGLPSLSSDEFLSLVNKERSQKGLSALSVKSALIKSTTLRADHLLLEGEKTNYKMQQSIASAGYSNILTGEFVSRGHFTAEELLESLLYNAGTAKQIMSKDYSDLGVSAVNKEISGCPTQVIVGHLGGYIPASYDQSMIDDWRSLLDNLNAVLPSWEKAVGYNNINQDKLSSLLTILRRRQNLAIEIIQIMEKKQWLSDSQLERIKNDVNDAKEAEQLAKELNKQ